VFHSKLGLRRKTKPQENKETRVPTTMRVSFQEIGNKTIAIYSLQELCVRPQQHSSTSIVFLFPLKLLLFREDGKQLL
jgi:hypothetical protein